MAKQKKDLSELDADLFGGLDNKIDFTTPPKYDGSLHNTLLIDEASQWETRQLSKVNQSFGEALVKAEQQRAANPDKPYVHWEAPRFETIHLVVLGEPKAQKRHRSVKIDNFIRQYDPSAKDKDNLLLVVQQQAPKEPLNCPINLKVDFYFTRPKAHFKTGKNASVLKDNCPTWHLSKPDADNCFKMISDALNKVFWRDDSLICQVTVNKRYDLNPRIEIFITPLA